MIVHTFSQNRKYFLLSQIVGNVPLGLYNVTNWWNINPSFQLRVETQYYSWLTQAKLDFYTPRETNFPCQKLVPRRLVFAGSELILSSKLNWVVGLSGSKLPGSSPYALNNFLHCFVRLRRKKRAKLFNSFPTNIIPGWFSCVWTLLTRLAMTASSTVTSLSSFVTLRLRALKFLFSSWILVVVSSEPRSSK